MTNESTTGLALISASLRLVGVLGEGQTASGDQALDALAVLKRLVDSWRIERLTISEVLPSVQNLTINVASYTIGSGATWNVDRPTWIEAASLLPTAGSYREIPLKVLSDQDYREFPRIKFASSTVPTAGIYYLNDFTSLGYGTIYLLETPSVSGLRILLYLPVSNIDIQNLAATTYLLPPGYHKALVYNLAKDLKDDYPGTWDPDKEKMAIDTKAAIKRINEVPGVLKASSMWIRRSTYDIRRGED